MKYHNLDLAIEREPNGGYLIQGKSDLGDQRDVSASDLASVRFDRTSVAGGQADAAALQVLGADLFTFLFQTRDHRRLEVLLNKSLGATVAPEAGLRIRILCDEANADVAAMPWEFLYHPVDRRFLATSVQTPLVRFLEIGQPIRPMETKLPLRILVVVPVAADLATNKEVELIEAALAPMGDRVSLTILQDIVTPDAVAAAMVATPFDVLHFMGHGDFDGKVASLRFNDPGGGRLDVGHDELGRLLRNQLSLKLVVLNSCQGGAQSGTTAFLGMAPRLIEVGVPAVVAMQFQVTDAESLVFAQAFYRALFSGSGQGSVDAAMGQARSELDRRFPGSRAFGVPALFIRYHEGVLFRTLSGNGLADALGSPDRGRSDEALLREHVSHGGGSPLGIADPILVGELRRAKQRVRLRRAAVLSTMAVAAAMVIAFAMSLLDRLPLSAIVAASPVWFGDPVAARLPVDSIAIVTTQQRITPEWRPRHAQLVDRLSEAGARVIVLDILFSSPQPAFDSGLADAFRRAAARGAAVVFGARDTAAGGVKAVAALAQAAMVGSACLGENSGRFSGVVPLVVNSPDGGLVVPSLALAALAGWRRGRVVSDFASARATIVDDREVAIDAVVATRVTTVADDYPTCPLVARGGRYAEVLAVRVPVARWRDPARRFDYAAVLDATPASLTWARGRIVLVGAVSEEELSTRRVGLGRDARYGVERHADAVATLLNGAEVRPLGGASHSLLIAVAAAGGGWLAYSRPRRRWQRVTLAAAGVVGLAAFATVLYYTSRLLVDLIYPMGAMMIGMGVVTVFRRRFAP